MRVELRRDGRTASLAVIDAGDGIPSAAREQAFLPFRRVHDAPSLSTCAGGKGGSAGLGLALVRQIARLHGGDAMAIARANAKSCIVVTLPVCG